MNGTPTRMFAFLLASYKVPEDWRINLFYIYFKKGSRGKPSYLYVICNIRQATSTGRKLLEKIQINRIYINLECQQLIRDSLQGFVQEKFCFTNWDF